MGKQDQDGGATYKPIHVGKVGKEIVEEGKKKKMREKGREKKKIKERKERIEGRRKERKERRKKIEKEKEKGQGKKEERRRKEKIKKVKKKGRKEGERNNRYIRRCPIRMAIGTRWDSGASLSIEKQGHTCPIGWHLLSTVKTSGCHAPTIHLSIHCGSFLEFFY